MPATAAVSWPSVRTAREIWGYSAPAERAPAEILAWPGRGISRQSKSRAAAMPRSWSIRCMFRHRVWLPHSSRAAYPALR